MTTKISSNREQQSPSKHHSNHDNKSDMTLSSTIVSESMIDGTENFQSGKPTELVLQSSNHLECSMTSSYADTPGDSGVLCLDSETSELTTASHTLMTQSLAEAEEIGCDVMNQSQLSQGSSISLMTKSDIDNQNVAQIPINAHVPEILTNNMDFRPSPSFDNLPDVVLKALEVEKESTSNAGLVEVIHTSEVYGIAPCNEPKKSSSDDIVYRRRCKKRNQSNPNAPKKRVSFHEDILNNTKTDNIHIEHGFVSYRDSNVYTQCERFRNRIAMPDRYSWCATSDCSPKANMYTPQQTMSDLLCYGGTGIDDCPDNTGIFEYNNTVQGTANETVPVDTYDITDNSRSDSYEENAPGENANMYMCDSNSSDSNLSCDSETSSSDSSSSSSNKISDESQQSNKCDKTQKSYSCDCFEDNTGKPLIKKMYFSEADIDQSGNECEQDMFLMNSLPSHTNVKSVLKKKRYIPTQVVEEHSSKKQKNRKGLSLMDTQNLFASLKSIYKHFSFGLGPAEKGLPEGDEDCHSVMEAMPIEPKPKTPFLSKSFDSGFHNEENDFVEINLKERNRKLTNDHIAKKNIHNVDNALKYNCDKVDAPNDQTMPATNEICRQQLTLNMKADCRKPFLNWRSQNGLSDNNKTLPERNKYVINCESTVYEHKGVSYCYVHDSFQTTFDTPRDTFVPLADKIQDKISSSTSSQIVSNMESDKDTPEKNRETKCTTDKPSDSSEKRNAPCERVMSDSNDNKTGVSKHLASPKKQNVKRYEKRLSYVRKATEDIQDTLSDISCNRENIEPMYSNNIIDMDDNIDLVSNSENALMRNSQKSTIINKYLRSVRQKKALEAKLQNNVFFQQKLREEERIFPDIQYSCKNVTNTYRQSAKKMHNLIDKEVIENRRLSVRLITADEPSYYDSFEDNVAMECCEKLKLELFIEPTEILHRMLKVRSPYKTSDGQWGPELVFITDRALYVADVTTGQKHYNLLWHLPHDKLDSIVMGADGQYVGVCSVYGTVRWIVPGEGSVASRLGASLAWSARHNPVPPALQPRRRRPLARALARAMQLQQTEGVMFYGQVCVVGTESTTEQSEGTGAPYGPPLEGYLMYRIEGQQRHWQPGYFLLKSGVVYYGAQSPGSVAPHYIKLDSVLGVRRCWVGSRPHCFELAGTTRLLLAAPDDHTASMWLQALLMHAAQALVQPSESGVCVRPGLPPACSLILTPTSIVTLREDISTDKPRKVEVLSCGSIRNLTAFKIPPNEENWCCMEWSVCEAREPGSELAVVFGSAAELERFIAAVELVWHATNSGVFPVSVSQVLRCSKVHKRYSGAWSHMLPTQH